MSVFTDIKVTVKSEDKRVGSYTIAPLPRGYGSTLGNSLRRVLLSSIPGAAATSVTVKGASHEYTAIEGVKEDVLEILLNIKAVDFSCRSDEPQICKLEISGKKSVTAKDIQVTGDVEVMNPDLHIATLTAASSKLVMEITVEKGVGYREADESERGVSGTLPLRAAFSPIKKINYKVVNARKGQETNLDGVDIEITTDGSITPKDALLESAKIIQDFSGKVMAALGVAQAEVDARAEAVAVIEEVVEEEAGLSEEVKNWKIEDMPISKRSKSGLLAGGYQVVGDLVDISTSDLLSLPGFGNKSLNEVVELMEQYGIEIKQ